MRMIKLNIPMILSSVKMEHPLKKHALDATVVDDDIRFVSGSRLDSHSLL